ncbi:HAMP domain-containing sensor histidine kinase [Nocardioides sp. SYSU D00038]|uniref:sensor histidine kinase n=1 Tax=Nocardioides sp. SYSU D00038 TaxID=2812554 RepID=UPI001967A9DD|nr:HAMP domain-containing sensor histidine kinase [Nocardioides sp. SYSU D00038]
MTAVVRRLTIRSRLALLCAAAVALGIVAASVVAWVAARETMRAQVDASLEAPTVVRSVRLAADAARDELPAPLPDVAARLCQDLPRTSEGDRLVANVQVILASGQICSLGRETPILEPTAEELAVATDGRGEVMRDAVDTDGDDVRVLTRPLDGGSAVQTVRSLEEVNATLGRLAWVLGLAAGLGVLLAALAGWYVARTTLRPVERVADAAEHVAATDDLSVPLRYDAAPSGAAPRDEVARLTSSFNAMTTRLAASRARQQQLVADASHELRTPVTSLRTHVEWLLRADDRGRPLSPEERRRVGRAVLGQVEELTDLIAELGEIARGGATGDVVPVRLDEVALRAVDRAQRRDPGRRLEIDVEEGIEPVLGDPAALERAVVNLLDNALKFSSGPVGVSVRARTVTVSDRGRGLPPADRAAAFGRFWRSAEARELPGSGLGLAIVADVAERHGGTTFFLPRDGGGSEVGFTVAGPAH